MTAELDAQLRAQLRATYGPIIRRENRRWTHKKWTAWSPEHLAARAAFKERWDALHAEGERMNFLVWSGGYADGEWEVDTSASYKDGDEFSETEEEYEARIRPMVDRRVEHELGEIKKRLKP